MSTEIVVLSAFAEADPVSFAQLLDANATAEGAVVLQALPVEAAASVVRAMAPLSAARTLESMKSDAAAALIRELPLDQSAALLRRCNADSVELMLNGGKDEAWLRALRRLLQNEPDSAGALMDPMVLAVPDDLDAAAVLDRIRRDPEHAMYYVYVVDRDGKLTGVVNVRELMLATGDSPIRSIMKPSPDSLPAHAGREAIAGHEAWQRVHALPVVDRNGEFLGAIRYEIVRRVEADLGLGTRAAHDRKTAVALAELYAIGLSGIAEFATATVGGGARAPRGGTTS